MTRQKCLYFSSKIERSQSAILDDTFKDDNLPNMASSSRRLFPPSGASTSFANNTDRGSNKRPRYSSSFRHRRKFLQHYVGFEDLELKPVARSFLDLDMRFFPLGVQPGTVWEIKGPEKAGKTFMLTYLIARMVVTYPEKKVVFIDTRHKFNIKNYISALCHIDPDLIAQQISLGESPEALIQRHPKVALYLDRVSIVKCYSADDLLFTVGPTGESSLEKQLLHDPKIGLVVIDAVDNFSYADSLKSLAPHQRPNIMQDLKESVRKTRCPVICTTLIPVGKHEYRRKQVARISATPQTQSNDNSVTDNNIPAVEGQQDNCDNNQDEKSSNLIMDYSAFTNILEIVPMGDAEREKIVHPLGKKITHYAAAYLRSRHSANMAGSGANHRVKFSIFSDMLWVDEAKH